MATPLKLQIEKVFIQTSERVKSVDFHPTEPRILASLYSGTVCIWNYHSQTIEKSFKVTESPVRTAKFIPNKNWFVCGSDDKFIRVYDYNTSEKVKDFKAHEDFIRCLAVHPTSPFVLSSSDDKLIKLWDWEKDWVCTRIFEGHSHYVMQTAFSPKDINTFASASLDGNVKVWNIDSSTEKFTWEAHSKGINCVNYFMVDDKLYLITGSDDYTAKVWDDETKSCMKILEGHTQNVTAACIHPELPIIITVSEDETVRIWDASTYRLEDTLNYGLERVWGIAYKKGSNEVAFGCDKGSVLVKIGRLPKLKRHTRPLTKTEQTPLTSLPPHHFLPLQPPSSGRPVVLANCLFVRFVDLFLSVLCFVL
ncbi:hypothetical protein QYF36_023546 [Acer negundo]|nr:hypothetical protein QYF36_023546 [Acer negundo]